MTAICMLQQKVIVVYKKKIKFALYLLFKWYD